MDYDIMVLGGGPAGAAAGLTLMKKGGLRVAMVERTDYTGFRPGESLSAGIRPMLEYMGVWEAFCQSNRRETFGTRSAWGSAETRALEYMFTVQGPGWNLDRANFDRLLADALEAAGGQVWRETLVKSCVRLPEGGWQVKVQHPNGEEHNHSASYLIDATGRKSLLARQEGVCRMIHDQQVGIVGQFAVPAGKAQVSELLIEARPYGWWYSAPLPGNKVVTVLMTDADLAAEMQLKTSSNWLRQLWDSPETSRRLTGGRLEAGPSVYSCSSSCLKSMGGQDWVAVGDTGAAHDPLSSSGIPNALNSGAYGALVALDALGGTGEMLKNFTEGVQMHFNQYLETRWRYYGTEQRWPEERFWKRRASQVRLDPQMVWQWPTGESIDLIHLPARAGRELQALCRRGRAAHEIVAELGALHPEIPDERIILGLQELQAYLVTA